MADCITSWCTRGSSVPGLEFYAAGLEIAYHGDDGVVEEATFEDDHRSLLIEAIYIWGKKGDDSCACLNRRAFKKQYRSCREATSPMKMAAACETL